MKNLTDMFRAMCALGLVAAVFSAQAAEPSLQLILSPYGGATNVTSTFSFSQLEAPVGSVITFDLIGDYTRWSATESFGIVDGSSAKTIFAPGSTLGEVASYTVGSQFTGIFFNSNSGDSTQMYPYGSEGGLEVFKLSGSQGDVFAYEDWKLHPAEVDYNDMVVRVSITPAVPELSTWVSMLLGILCIVAMSRLRRRRLSISSSEPFRLAI
jgi:hypothetical protein